MIRKIVIKLIVSLLIILGLISLLNPFFEDKLLRFTAITKSDPLFYDPNMDSSFLRRVTSELKKMDDAILFEENKIRKQLGHKNPYPTGWRLWPDKFMETLPNIHELTEQFIARPTVEKGLSLLEKYSENINGYKKSITNHILALENDLAKNPGLEQKKILFLGSATTPRIVYEDFLLIQKNAFELEREVRKRRDCLVAGKCVLSKPHFNEQSEPSKLIAFNPLPDKILGIDRTESKVYGPYYASTACFGRENDGKFRTYPFYIVERKRGNDLTIKPMLSNTRYYRDYSDISKRSPEDLLYEKGIIIRPHPETNDYMCTDFTYYSDLVDEYMHKKGLKKNGKGNKLATLPYIIDNALKFNEYILYNIKYSKKPYAPSYLLTVRTAYSVYFVTFSEAVWRLKEKPEYLLPQDYSPEMSKTMYMKYEDLISNGYSDEEIISFNDVPQINEVFREFFEEKEINNN